MKNVLETEKRVAALLAEERKKAAAIIVDERAVDEHR